MSRTGGAHSKAVMYPSAIGQLSQPPRLLPRLRRIVVVRRHAALETGGVDQILCHDLTTAWGDAEVKNEE